MVVVLGFCPSLGVPLGDRLSSGDMALDVVEISIVLFVRSWFERLARLWQEGEGRLVSLCRLVGFRFLQVFLYKFSGDVLRHARRVSCEAFDSTCCLGDSWKYPA